MDQGPPRGEHRDHHHDPHHAASAPHPAHDVVLGSNPKQASRWAQRTGRAVDIADIADIGSEEDDAWSIACNLDRVGPGTVGWIARQGEGSKPPLCGVIVCTAAPKMYPEDAAGNTVDESYVEGRLHGGLWVPGDDIAAAGWPPRRSPWAAAVVHSSGTARPSPVTRCAPSSPPSPASILRTITLERCAGTGRMPWWASGGFDSGRSFWMRFEGPRRYMFRLSRVAGKDFGMPLELPSAVASDPLEVVDVGALSSAEAGYVRAALAANTLRGYRSDWTELCAWSTSHGYPAPRMAPQLTTAG